MEASNLEIDERGVLLSIPPPREDEGSPPPDDNHSMLVQYSGDSLVLQDEVRSNDVLSGRGNHILRHPGNVRMREKVQELLSDYNNAKSNKKKTKIVASVRIWVENDCKGRFLVPIDQHIPALGYTFATKLEIHNKVSHLFRDRHRERGGNTEEDEKGQDKEHRILPQFP